MVEFLVLVLWCESVNGFVLRIMEELAEVVKMFLWERVSQSIVVWIVGARFTRGRRNC